MNKAVLKKKSLGKSASYLDDVKREIAIVKKLDHPNVLRLFEVMDDPKVNKLYLVVEYVLSFFYSKLCAFPIMYVCLLC